MNVYVFGNSLLDKDSVALKILPGLRERFPEIKFIEADPNENFPPPGLKKPIILDTVLGIKKPMILELEDFEKLKKTPVGGHDYDLGFHLRLLKKMGKIEGVKIIGVSNSPSKENLELVCCLLKSLRA